MYPKNNNLSKVINNIILPHGLEMIPVLSSTSYDCHKYLRSERSKQVYANECDVLVTVVRGTRSSLFLISLAKLGIFSIFWMQVISPSSTASSGAVLSSLFWRETGSLLSGKRSTVLNCLAWRAICSGVSWLMFCFASCSLLLFFNSNWILSSSFWV